MRRFKQNAWGLRAYELLVVLALAGAAYGAKRAVWFSPGKVVRVAPDAVQPTPNDSRRHRRHRVGLGGK